MAVDFQVLESQLSETEMALFSMINVSMNAAMLAGADPKLIVQHLRQHEQNFTVLGQKKAAHLLGAAIVLVENASGIKPFKLG
ncbi:hypothetical protein [Sinorhizobium fredii]|uniref:hypothetical protein n=1 Tax=Rhizobium fredii TaxID=380 RepID=UPI00210EB1BC|nr:hypothetical protein [Sinorhizobium fredii]UTY50406.1 hypothetical protein EPK84_28460 [Sinorhizobium fredii]